MERERLGSRLGFILLSAGCAIGLGNVYRFPIITGAYGGALFVLIYLGFLILLGIPVMCCELSVGRGSQRSIASSFEVMEKKGQKWHLMKYLGIVANYLLMSFYTVVSSYFLVYLIRFLNGSIMQATDLSEVFIDTATILGISGTATPVIIVLCFGICALGLKNGVERITKVMMVALFLLMAGLAGYSLTLPGAREGLSFYLVPSLKSIETQGLWTVISAAMGQAFFTLSLGIGSIAIFGSYIGKDRSLLGESITIVSLDTLVAIMSGLIIFPAFFTANPGGVITAQNAGASFLFMTLSSIFTGMKAGRILGSLFFLFMVFAAFSTVIAVFENIMSFWLELTKLKRWQVAVINIFIVSALACPVVLSYCTEAWGAITVMGKILPDFADFLVSNIALPFGSLMYVLFCTRKFGWGWDSFYTELNTGKGKKFPAGLRFYMSSVLPCIIAVVLVMSLM